MMTDTTIHQNPAESSKTNHPSFLDLQLAQILRGINRDDVLLLACCYDEKGCVIAAAGPFLTQNSLAELAIPLQLSLHTGSSERLADVLQAGEIERQLIFCTHGILALERLTSAIYLVLLTRADTPLGLTQTISRRLIERIKATFLQGIR